MKEFKNARDEKVFVLNKRAVQRHLCMPRNVIIMTLPPTNSKAIIQSLGRTEVGTLQTIMGCSLLKLEIRIWSIFREKQ